MISGLVIHLADDALIAREAFDLIERQPSVEIGEEQARSLAVVLETESPHTSQQITDWIIGLAGVTHVDVAFVHLETFDDSQEGQRS